MGSIPGRVTCLSCGFGSRLGCVQETAEHFSPFLSPSLPLSGITKTKEMKKFKFSLERLEVLN